MDYQSIINNLKTEDIKHLLYKLGAKTIIEKENCLITNTICHNTEEGSLKLYYYFDTHMFYCYSNCQAMSVFKFLKHYYDCRDIDYDWYNDIYNVVINCSTYQEREGFYTPKYKSLKDIYGVVRKEVVLPEYSKGVLDIFVKKYPTEWLNDGISREAMDKYNVLYSISQNKIVIPHYDVTGRLVGIRGRALNDWEIENIGKYMPLKIEQTWYKHPLSMNLYGLYQNKDNIKQNGICYIFESEKSVMQFETFNMPHCAVAVCGSQFNIFQLKLLLKYCQPKEIVICFDKEELPSEDKYFNKLYTIGKKYQNYCNFSFIYDREGLLSLKDSPSDKGQEIFIKLLQKRVRIR